MIEYTVQVDDDRTAWMLDGEFHREDGPAIECKDGNNGWYQNGKLHRLDGPALMQSNGTNAWYVNGLHHREDGPAVEFIDGSFAWWINGVKLTKNEFDTAITPVLVKELTVNEVEQLLGYKIKVIAG